MIPRYIFTEEHEQFRDSVKKFIAAEVTPYHRQWEKDGKVSREVWLKAGANGFLCSNAPEEYGGAGVDFKYNAIFTEELGRAGITGPGFGVHSDMAAAYILNFGSDEQKKQWLPKMASGEVIAALGLTEPGAGSDLKAIRTTAIRDGDDYVINGQKVYISNGQLCDIVILACKTDPAAGAKGMTFIIVETTRKGFERGRNLEKLGLKAQDTSEMFFTDVRVPVTNRIGAEGKGFAIAMHNLAEERLSIAVSAIRACEGILESTEAAMAKMLAGELQCKVADECLQFYGGYGYMMEYQIAHAYLDARIRKIAGGSSEVMRDIISRKVFA